MKRIWRQMTQLYRYKWTSSEGLSVDDNGLPTENFLIWAYELSEYGDKSLMRGLSKAQKKHKDSEGEGFAVTLEVFKGYCDKPKLSPASGANVDAYKTIGNYGIPDITKRDLQAARNHNKAQLFLQALKEEGPIKI